MNKVSRGKAAVGEAAEDNARMLTKVEFAPEVAVDFERILNHLLEYEIEETTSRVQGIIAAIDVLEHNPLIGRPAQDDYRELVMGRGSQGYVALYRYVEAIDTVFVLAVRSQREAGYSRK